MILDILNEGAQDLDNLSLITEGGPQQLFASVTGNGIAGMDSSFARWSL